MSDDRLRRLERAHRTDPNDLGALRELADERKRLGLELLPARIYVDPLEEAFALRHAMEAIGRRFGLELEARMMSMLMGPAERFERPCPTRGASMFPSIVSDLEAIDRILAAQTWPYQPFPGVRFVSPGHQWVDPA